MATPSTLQKRLSQLLQVIGADIKTLTSGIGNLTLLNTNAKNSLVSAINELHEYVATVEPGTDLIDDQAAPEVSGKKTYSVSKIKDLLNTLEDKIKEDLIGGAPEAIEALRQLSDVLGTNENFATAVAEQLGKRVRYDGEQTLSEQEQATVRANIGAASTLALEEFKTAIGNTEIDLVEVYNNAKK